MWNMYLYYYIQIPLTCIPKSTVHSVYCICKVHGKTHNCSNDVGKLKCQWVLWLCRSATYSILSTNNLNHFINNGLWKIQYKLIWRAVKKKGEGKAVPLQAWSGPEGSRKLRFPGFMTTAKDGGKVVSLRHRPPLPPGNIPGTHFC